MDYVATCSRSGKQVFANNCHSLEIIFLLEPAEVENLNIYFVVDLDTDREERKKCIIDYQKIIRSQRHKLLSGLHHVIYDHICAVSRGLAPRKLMLSAQRQSGAPDLITELCKHCN